MKTKRTISFYFLFFFMLIAGSQSFAQPLPVAFLPERQFEFEAVPEGSEVVHDFLLKNTGSAPLHVKKVLTG